ncbi:MAG: glycerophosphoryl diester phosphodiesterase membrane domain-containing protein [Actinobacteria bacterium]|nr:glycerophosphoryl diester phosphodiesterase membrane domain-containing protein [Actinomycetota bacterium]
MSWGQDPEDRERDFDPWNTERGRDVPAQPQPGGADPWGGDASPERLRPLSLGEVLDGTFRLARRHWRAFAIGLGVVVVPLSLLSGFVLAQMFGSTPGLLETLQNPEVAGSFDEQDFEQFTETVVGSGLAGIAGLLLSPLIYGIAVWIAARGYRAGTVEPMDGVRAAGRRYLPLLAAVILVGILPLLIFLLPGFVLATGAAAGVDALLVAGGVGVIVSAVVAIIAVVRLLLTVPAVMLERAGPVQAMRRSNTLVKGRTGFVLGTMLVVYIVVTIVNIVLGLPFQALGAAVGTAVGAVVITAGSIVTSLLSNTLLGAALVLIYFDRRVRAEGYDLSQLADELGDPGDHGW